MICQFDVLVRKKSSSLLSAKRYTAFAEHGQGLLGLFFSHSAIHALRDRGGDAEALTSPDAGALGGNVGPSVAVAAGVDRDKLLPT